jgi:HPt (histidine-containing phosphotransfer) domain-containing protein
MMPVPTIDRATFDALKETTGAEFVRELIDAFLQEAPAMLSELRAAYARADAEAFRRIAHSLKSNGNTFGALRFGAMARELEVGGMAKAREGDGAPLDGLGDEYSHVAAVLTELRDA